MAFGLRLVAVGSGWLVSLSLLPFPQPPPHLHKEERAHPPNVRLQNINEHQLVRQPARHENRQRPEEPPRPGRPPAARCCRVPIRRYCRRRRRRRRRPFPAPLGAVPPLFQQAAAAAAAVGGPDEPALYEGVVAE